MLEDNRVLKEQAKKARTQLKDYERTITAQNDQVMRLQDELKKLRAASKGAASDPVVLKELEALKAQLATKEIALNQLAQRVDVAEKARVVDGKKAKAQVAEALRQRDAAVAEMRDAQAYAEEKDKELRRALIKIRELQDQLRPIRDVQAMQKRAVEDERRLSALKEEVDGKLLLLEEPRVFIMPLIIAGEVSGGRGQPGKPRPQPPHRRWLRVCLFVQEKAHRRRRDGTGETTTDAMGEEEAATVIQASFRGHRVRRGLKKEETPAIARIDAVPGDDEVAAAPPAPAEASPAAAPEAEEPQAPPESRLAEETSTSQQVGVNATACVSRCWTSHMDPHPETRRRRHIPPPRHPQEHTRPHPQARGNPNRL